MHGNKFVDIFLLKSSLNFYFLPLKEFKPTKKVCNWDIKTQGDTNIIVQCKLYPEVFRDWLERLNKDQRKLSHPE